MSYLPSERKGSRIGKAKANAATWKHPAGHASWCTSAVPFNRYASVGGTPMARSQCSCPRNAVAKALRSIEAGRKAAAEGSIEAEGAAA